jgi:hypothetical protein
MAEGFMFLLSGCAAARNVLIPLLIAASLAAIGAPARAQLVDPRIAAQDDPAGFARHCANSGVEEWLAADAARELLIGETRRDCLFYLRDIEVSDPEAFEAIGQAIAPLLSAPEVEIRMQALLTIGKFAYAPAAAQVALSLESTDWREAFAAARALGALGDASIMPELRVAADHHWSLTVREEAWMAAMALGAELPWDERQADLMAGLPADELEAYRAYLEDYRHSLRVMFGLEIGSDEDFPGLSDDLWAGDASTFSEFIGVAFDERGQIVDPCPSRLFRLGEWVIDTRAESPPSVERLQQEFEIPLQGGRLVASITDFNIQYFLGMPGEVVWIGDNGTRNELLERSIQLHTGQGLQSILLANAGYGPSPGAVYVIHQEAGEVELEALVQLPGPPIALHPLGAGRYAVVTRGGSVIVFDRDGVIGQAECEEVTGAAAVK